MNVGISTLLSLRPLSMLRDTKQERSCICSDSNMIAGNPDAVTIGPSVKVAPTPHCLPESWAAYVEEGADGLV
jgi:hypothetical protein